jgi:hypothetical protein
MDYFKYPLKARGLHPLGAPLVHPTDSQHLEAKMLISIKMKTFEWITSKIHSKLGGYTLWVPYNSTKNRPCSEPTNRTKNL